MSNLSGAFVNLLGRDAQQTAQQAHRQVQQQLQQEHFKKNLTPEEYENLKLTAKKFQSKQISKEQYDSFIKNILSRFPFPDNFAQMIKERVMQQPLANTAASSQLPIQQQSLSSLPIQQTQLPPQTQQPVAPTQQKLKELITTFKTLSKEEKPAFLKQHPEMYAFLKSLEQKAQPPAQSQQQPPPPQSQPFNNPLQQRLPPQQTLPPQPKQSMMAALGASTSLMGTQQPQPPPMTNQQDFFRQAQTMNNTMQQPMTLMNPSQQLIQQQPPSSSTPPPNGQPIKAAQASSSQVADKSKAATKKGKAGATSKQDGTDKKKEVDEWNPDVASVGVDLDEEEQNMTTLRSEQEQQSSEPQSPVYHPEQPLLNKAPLNNKLNRIARKKGLKTVNDDAVDYMTQAVQIRMRSIIEELIRIAHYRNDAASPNMVDKSSIHRAVSNDDANKFHTREISQKKQMLEQERQKSEEEQKRLQMEKEKEEEKQRKKRKRQQEEDAAARARSTNAAVELAMSGTAPNVRSKRRERVEREEETNFSHGTHDKDDANGGRASKRRRDGIKIMGKDVVLFMEQDALLRKSKVLYSISSKIKTRE